MVDVPPRCLTSRELDYDITDTWDDLVGAIDEIASTTLEGVRIYQKSHETRQKRESTDTRIRRVQKEAKESNPKPEKSNPQSTLVNHGQ
ncbi:hypothetical protein Tco_1025721 [Tanacetum coccineum]